MLERERKEKKMPFIVATYILPAAKGSARTPLGPIFVYKKLRKQQFIYLFIPFVLSLWSVIVGINPFMSMQGFVCKALVFIYHTSNYSKYII